MDNQHSDNQHSTGADQSPPVESLRRVLDEPIEVKLHLLQHYAEMARLLAAEIMDEEVETLAGERYSRDKPCGGRYRRWGRNPGSICVDGERVPVDVPRVRDVEAGVERPLQSYRSMKEAAPPGGLAEAILLGLSQGDYERVAGQFIDGFGLSQSSVSRRFQQRAEQALQEFEGRPLEEENFLALWIDGKHVAGEQMIISVGVTEKGHKRVLGFTQATTERAEPIKELLRELIERGLSFDEGILCVVDGGRGVRKAIDDVFGRRARVQRCQWHKRENVVSYLPKADQKTWRSKLQRAYQEPSYEAAKARLMELKAELEPINRRAARSLMEGLEETLTLHRLGLFEELGRSLKTTNCIENLNGQVERRLGNVKRWHHSPQRHRWMALALLEAETRMRRLTGYRHLSTLKRALKDAIPDRE
ncbi:MAG: IS256 family transposase [Bacteroidetes bacterium]|jgi:transposase-like protein|nr:IS256 family transposase [Bacteroidota bacterium]